MWAASSSRFVSLHSSTSSFSEFLSDVPFVGCWTATDSFGSVSGSWIVMQIIDGKRLECATLCGKTAGSWFAMEKKLNVFDERKALANSLDHI